MSPGATTFVVVLAPLQFGDLADRAQRRAADFAHAFGDLVGRIKNLLALFVE